MIIKNDFIQLLWCSILVNKVNIVKSIQFKFGNKANDNQNLRIIKFLLLVISSLQDFKIFKKKNNF